MVPAGPWNHDGDMNETLDTDQAPGPSSGDPAGNPGPAPQPQIHQDLDRLRRSTTNRYIAGVAGGLGRHFNIDPTIIRVLLVVLSFFGGAGVLIYAVCWLFVPEDNAAHAPIRVGSEPRKILLLAAAGIAFLLAVGDAFNGFDAGWPIVSIAVLVAVVLIIRDRRHGEPEPGTPVAAPGTTTTAGAGTSAPAYSGPSHGTEQTAVFNPTSVQPPWQPPVVRPPLVSPHPKRTGILWFWPTIALIAVGLGILGIYDNGHHVVDGAYPALALAITAVMLLVGSVVGRPGGLILVGFVSSVALAGSLVVGGSFGTDARNVRETPTSSAQVRPEYSTTVGEIVLDLTRVSDPAALAGRTIDVHLRTGHIDVIVPRSLNVTIDANMDFAGGVEIPGDDSGGFNHEVHKSLYAVPASTADPLALELDAKFGQITVEYR
jgi:phage shock protein PspC (stress-responsive transcriptional regulator)